MEYVGFYSKLEINDASLASVHEPSGTSITNSTWAAVGGKKNKSKK